jgi:hypothetical protein
MSIFHRCWDCLPAPGRMTHWCARRTSGWPRSTTRTRTPRAGICSRKSTPHTSISAQSPPASVQVCCPEKHLVMQFKFIFIQINIIIIVIVIIKVSWVTDSLFLFYCIFGLILVSKPKFYDNFGLVAQATGSDTDI